MDAINISTHSLTKRLTTINPANTVSQSFQLTASRRGWPCSRPHVSTDQNYFNSQPHEEADPLVFPYSHLQTYFNSQPHEEADRDFICRTGICMYFNSQPHEEADFLCQMLCDIPRISTHSLTKRLTLKELSGLLFQTIFQLTASRRGWQCFAQLSIQFWHFNSQPHEEADD